MGTAKRSASRKSIPRLRSPGRAAIASKDGPSYIPIAIPAGPPPSSVTHRQARPDGLTEKFQIFLARFKPFFQNPRDLGYVDGKSLSTAFPPVAKASAFLPSPPTAWE